MSYRIDALLEEHFPSVAKFLDSFHASSQSPRSDIDIDVSVDRLTHRLCHNPAQTGNAPLGYLLRKSDNDVVGTIFFIPGGSGWGTNPFWASGLGASTSTRRPGCKAS